MAKGRSVICRDNMADVISKVHACQVVSWRRRGFFETPIVFALVSFKTVCLGRTIAVGNPRPPCTRRRVDSGHNRLLSGARAN
jgi:hypothetical protein